MVPSLASFHQYLEVKVYSFTNYTIEIPTINLCSKSGGYLCFEGRIRDKNNGQEVLSVEYEIYEALAHVEAKKIIEEVKEKFLIHQVEWIHRTGHLKVGELALWVRLSSKHRKESFLAMQWLIDAIKSRLPIWKKEYYKDQKAEWVACQGCKHTIEEQDHYYLRQKTLPLVGEQGQNKLLKSRILVIGAGGLGCPALSYLTTSGIGTIGICDGDQVEVSNLHRQILYTHEDIGTLKAVAAKKALLTLNPRVHIETFPFFFKPEIIKNFDVILDCTDSLRTGFKIHDAAFIENIPVIQANIYQMHAQMNVFRHRKQDPCLRCLWEDIPRENSSKDCAQAGVLGMACGALGSLQAIEALKVILGNSEVLDGKSLFLDLLSYNSRKISFSKRKICSLCSSKKSKVTPKRNQIEISLDELLTSPNVFDFIDIRNTPLPETFNENKTYIFYCQKGIRSANLTQELRDNGYENIYSLEGGISSYEKYLSLLPN